MMTTISTNITDILHSQREFFNSGKTRDLDFRLSQLHKLKQLIIEHQTEIITALKADLNKPEFESYASEIGAIKEVDEAIKNLRKWAKTKKAPVPLEFFSYSAKISPEPLGVVLIISPWNYPFQLIISPLVGAIAAGNCTIVKPSEFSPHTANLVRELISKYFDPAYISVIPGGVETSQELLAEKFDHILFTGGTAIGKIVMAAAAKHLTPVTLELGGKSPCIVDTEINLDHTVKRILWGKFLNAGQTCIAPDYLLVNEKVKSDLINGFKRCLLEFYGENPANSPDYARIIHQKHFDRLTKFLQDGEIIIGGETNREQLYIAPTIIDNVALTDAIMEEEIFGPILPVITYTDISQAITLINSQPKPLALYLFSDNKNLQNLVLQSTSSGSVCINDTVMQVAISSLPFGGVGDSGIGAYHGKASFDLFSHHKSILQNTFRFDVNWRYAPYQGKLSLLRKIIGI